MRRKQLRRSLSDAWDADCYKELVKTLALAFLDGGDDLSNLRLA